MVTSPQFCCKHGINSLYVAATHVCSKRSSSHEILGDRDLDCETTVDGYIPSSLCRCIPVPLYAHRSHLQEPSVGETSV